VFYLRVGNICSRFCCSLSDLRASSCSRLIGCITFHRPKMAVLGSREQMCIHDEVRALRGRAQNNACHYLCKKRRCRHNNLVAGNCHITSFLCCLSFAVLSTFLECPSAGSLFNIFKEKMSIIYMSGTYCRLTYCRLHETAH
jgi:hypothetical protein